MTDSPSIHLRTAVRAALAVTLLATLGLAFGTTHASAAASAKPCWKKVLNDWFVDGRIDGTYPPSCLNAAMAHLPQDAKEYSSFSDEAHRALLADEKWIKSHPKRKAHYNFGVSGGHKGGGDWGPPPPVHKPGAPGTAGGGGGGPIPAIIAQGSPASATSIPVPLLVLGGVAIALMLAGVASYLLRRFRGGGGPPAPSPQG